MCKWIEIKIENYTILITFYNSWLRMNIFSVTSHKPFLIQQLLNETERKEYKQLLADQKRNERDQMRDDWQESILQELREIKQALSQMAN
jgi:hypothetical protein